MHGLLVKDGESRYLKKEKISTHAAAVTDEKNEEKHTQNEAVNKKFRKFAQVDAYLRPSRRQHDLYEQ